ncbi:MAG TPA: phosphopantetheine-binding protein [Myxococcota bacterium]|jgi:acyl carrier protein|nr:phosphopantetheine-binding protein [Myxococcota bacterium]
METNELRGLILSLLGPRLRRSGLAADALRDDQNLLESGVLDSFAFVQFLQVFADRCGFELELGEIDPASLTTLQGLIDYAQGLRD